VAPRGPGAVIRADPRQVYRGMDVATGKPTPGERAAVRHHLIDIADPDDRYNAARFCADALRVEAAAVARHLLADDLELVLAPCDRSAIWLGKTLAVFVFLTSAELVALPAFALFFAPIDLVVIAGVVLASIGICAVGSLLAAMAAASRGREVILPLLFLPLAIPLIVGGVGAGISPEGATYLTFLGLYDLVFAILAWATFEYVITE